MYVNIHEVFALTTHGQLWDRFEGSMKLAKLLILIYKGKMAGGLYAHSFISLITFLRLTSFYGFCVHIHFSYGFYALFF